MNWEGCHWIWWVYGAQSHSSHGGLWRKVMSKITAFPWSGLYAADTLSQKVIWIANVCHLVAFVRPLHRLTKHLLDSAGTINISSQATECFVMVIQSFITIKSDNYTQTAWISLSRRNFYRKRVCRLKLLTRFSFFMGCLLRTHTQW